MQENTENKNAPIYSDFAYDDAFRTMETECDDILIPFVNYFYNENYDASSKIIRLRNEHFIEHANKSDEKRITDSHFQIVQNDRSSIYHFECESKPYDNSILVRLFEYDSQIAVDESDLRSSVLRVRFPYTGLLLLRKSKKTPDKAKIVIETPNGEVSYDVTLIRESDFTIDSIFEHRLYLMIPFYIFNYESDLVTINEDPERIELLGKLYEDIISRLDHELDQAHLSAFSHNAIIRLTHKVIYKLTMKHVHVQEKVGGIMGGKVLDLPEIRVFHEGIEKGIVKGIEKGIEKGKITARFEDGMPIDEIARKTKVSENTVKAVLSEAGLL